jgi:hypothetical protein
MPGPVLGIVGAIVITFAVLAAGFVVGMRRKSGLVQGPVIWFTKHGINKVGLKTAGRAGSTTSIIRHRGRVSGNRFDTPVDALPTDDGFLISLPYGLRSNWLRNVLASGSAELVHDGETWLVDEPAMIPLADVATRFEPGDQRLHRIFNVTHVLRLHRASRATVEDGSQAVVARAA